MKHFLVFYIDRYEVQAYHRKTYCYPSQQKKIFLSYKVANKIIKVVFSKFLYLIANWISYPKPIKEALTILKSLLKLLITSSYNGQQLIFLENQVIF